MSFSKESQDYHLTPNGWTEGSFHGDILGGQKIIEIPSDRVLTIRCTDETPYVYQDPVYYDKVIWQSDDDVTIKYLQMKYGEKPDWFGYLHDDY